MSDAMKKLIKNPLNLENIEDLDNCDINLTNGLSILGYSCKPFCQAFNIGKPVSILDGDIKSMDVIFDYLM